MGVRVSSWSLARAVSATGQLGVVSGTALDVVLARVLQDGDPGGHARAALAAFPVPQLAARVLDRYFRPAGREPGTPYAAVPRLRLHQDRHAQELAVVANFAEVWLAKRGHQGPVGVNYLEKVQMALPAAAYGAMLAGVDMVLVGAGIPRELPRLLTALASHEPVSLPVDVAGTAEGQRHTVNLDPVALLGRALPPLRGLSSWPSSPRMSSPSTLPAIPRSGPMGLSSRDQPPAATTHRPGAGSRWTRTASPATARATTRTWPG